VRRCRFLIDLLRLVAYENASSGVRGAIPGDKREPVAEAVTVASAVQQPAREVASEVLVLIVAPQNVGTQPKEAQGGNRGLSIPSGIRRA
jgi:hypothetical protein